MTPENLLRSALDDLLATAGVLPDDESFTATGKVYRTLYRASSGDAPNPESCPLARWLHARTGLLVHVSGEVHHGGRSKKQWQPGRVIVLGEKHVPGSTAIVEMSACVNAAVNKFDQASRVEEEEEERET